MQNQLLQPSHSLFDRRAQKFARNISGLSLTERCAKTVLNNLMKIVKTENAKYLHIAESNYHDT